eukprot:s502_g4.t1
MSRRSWVHLVIPEVNQDAVPQKPAVPVMSSSSCAESTAFGAELRHLRKASGVEDLLARETLQALILGVASYSATATLMWSPVPTPQNAALSSRGPHSMPSWEEQSWSWSSSL